MKFSVYYRIQQRDEYFQRFFRQISRKFPAELVPELEGKYEDLMELLVKFLLDEDSDNMKLLLCRPNAKVARVFFDFLTVSHVKNKKKSEIVSRVDEVYKKEDTMVEFKKFLSDKLIEFDMSEELRNQNKISLKEADDDDPFGGDSPDDDDGRDEGEGDGNSDAEKDSEGDKAEDGEPNLDDYEDDPDFTKGTQNTDDATLSDTPSGECVYDVDGVMKALATVIQSSSESDLSEIGKVKRVVELIFNGKVLKPEDVMFDDPRKASELIKKVGSKVNDKTRNYLVLKVKEPLIRQRDSQKMELAKAKKNVGVTRDTLQDLDK